MKEKLIISKNLSGYFVKFNDEELLLFAKQLKQIIAKKGELLIKEGEIATGIFWVSKGLLRQYYFKNGRDITEHFACDGQGAFCIESIFNKTPSKLIVEALEKSVVYLIPYYEIINLSKKHPKFGTLIRKLLEHSLILSQKKADSLRYETVRERYERFLVDYPCAAKRASVNHVASFLLMTPESLSRVRAGTL